MLPTLFPVAAPISKDGELSRFLVLIGFVVLYLFGAAVYAYFKTHTNEEVKSETPPKRTSDDGLTGAVLVLCFFGVLAVAVLFALVKGVKFIWNF